MKKHQFRLKTLLLLTAALAAVLAVCSQWPVKEFAFQLMKDSEGHSYYMTSVIERPPTIKEWLIRVAISVAVLVASALLGRFLNGRARHLFPSAATKSPGSL
jgi:hypothetical protein